MGLVKPITVFVLALSTVYGPIDAFHFQYVGLGATQRAFLRRPTDPRSGRCNASKLARHRSRRTATDPRSSDSGHDDFSYEELIERAQEVAATSRNATEDPDGEAERLHREVFQNEKGFLKSETFNPTRAKEKQEDDEAKRLADDWGSTPEKAREVIDKTKKGKEMSFQELDAIAKELNMSDDQQRAFVLKASMKQLSSAMAPPKRKPVDPAKEALQERVFASEKGFRDSSEGFKTRMRAGSGVRFDADGFPVLDEGDPIIQAARKSKRPRTKSNIEDISFPTLPDCPLCSAPTIEDELSQFGMCSQCRADQLSAATPKRPPEPSKYTYDNGEAPFSGSWYSAPVPSRGNGGSPDPSIATSPSAVSSRGRHRPAGSNVGGSVAGPPSADSSGRGLSSADGKSAYPSGSPGGNSDAGPASVGIRASAAGASTPSPVRAASASSRVPVVDGPAADGKPLRGVAPQRSTARAKATAPPVASKPTGTSTLAMSPAGSVPSGVVNPAVRAATETETAEKRDADVRRLIREVSELRTEVSHAVEKLDAAESRRVQMGGESEAMQKMSREVVELRAQLESGRKEHAITRSTLRRLQDEVDRFAAKSSPQ